MRKRGVGLALVALCAASARGHATEFGNSHADLGFIDVLTGLPPPPGIYVRDDVNFVVSSRLNDGQGNKVNLNTGALGRGRFGIKFRNTVEADILSFAYVPDFKVPYINATIGVSAYGAFANSRAGVTTRLGIPEAAANDKAGFNDPTVVPVFLGFDSPKTDLHAILAPFDFTVPIGRYSPTDPIGNNIGLNFWSYRPALAITYLNKTGQELNLNLGASFNFQNQATHYKSGDEFYVNWSGQQHFTTQFAAGLSGYYYKQVSNDTLNGRVVNTSAAAVPFDPLNAGPGNRGETFAIGPTFSYIVSNGLLFEAHWDHELVSYNRQQRDQVYAHGTIRF